MKKLLKYLADLRWWRLNIEGSKIDPRWNRRTPGEVWESLGLD